MHRQPLIINLSGEQKRVLGFASWSQVSITAGGLIVGVILFALVKAFFSLLGAGLGFSVIVASFFFLLAFVPVAIIAFKPIRDNQGNILYYQSKQFYINYRFKRYEIGTYLNLKGNVRPVNSRLPYVCKSRSLDE